MVECHLAKVDVMGSSPIRRSRFFCELFGGEEQLKIQQERDAVKAKYCKDNNITLIIIKYDCCVSKMAERVEKILEKIILECEQTSRLDHRIS